MSEIIEKHASRNGGEQFYGHKIASLVEAEALAAALTERDGALWLPVDRSRSTWPRYSVTKAPAVGDEVSYGFNGDYYVCGVVVSVTKGTAHTVRTDTGHTFRRSKLTASWLRTGGTWSLVAGHHTNKNPHF
jgi:hypothetical protein